MKRGFHLFLLGAFIAYLGCKSSLFAECTKDKVSLPSCHQSQSSVVTETNHSNHKPETSGFCDCPVSLEELKIENFQTPPKIHFVVLFTFPIPKTNYQNLALEFRNVRSFSNKNPSDSSLQSLNSIRLLI